MEPNQINMLRDLVIPNLKEKNDGPAIYKRRVSSQVVFHPANIGVDEE